MGQLNVKMFNKKKVNITIVVAYLHYHQLTKCKGHLIINVRVLVPLLIT